MKAKATAETSSEWAKRAFEAMAPVCDDFTAHYEYEFWISHLLEVLERDGLRGTRLLDIGCGTGKSFLPMLPRGWKVTGCDISDSMLQIARGKVDESVSLSVADMRELPGCRLAWRGKTSAEVAPSSICESHLEIETDDSDGAAEEPDNVSVHRQRHFSEAEVLAAIARARAGLECLNVYGHSTDGIPCQPLDDSIHAKAIYVARRAALP